MAPNAEQPNGKETDTSNEEGQTNDSVTSEIRLCEHCCNRYEESKTTKKVEEIVKTVSLEQYQEKVDEHAKKYKTVVEENENLRIGMHEILEKLREYDGEVQSTLWRVFSPIFALLTILSVATSVISNQFTKTRKPTFSFLEIYKLMR
jgi:hypothetical protein